jgi:replicative superfamily II helicase
LAPLFFYAVFRAHLAISNSSISVGNLIYSAPTSGGKTLVSEILMLRKIALIPGGTIFFIVPFIALAEEKAEYLRAVWGDMFIGIKSFHGEDGGQALTKDVDVAVCTIER